MSRATAAVLFASLAWAGCAEAPPAPPPKPAGESPLTLEVEAGLPRIEAALAAGREGELLPELAAKGDRASKLLFAFGTREGQESWKRFHALEGIDGPDAWAEIGMAHVYLGWKTWDQAAQALGRAMQADSKIAELFSERADLERARGDLSAAKADDESALALHPGFPFALNGLAAIARASGDLPEATRRWKEAIASWPDDFEAELGLADAAKASGDGAAELAALDRLHALAPADASPWLRSGRLREKQGDLTGAAKDFEAALQRGADAPDLEKLLAETYRKEGRTADERRILEKLAQEAPDAKSLSRLAALELADGKTDLALRHYGKAVELDPKDEEAQLALARLWVQTQAYAQAIGAYRELASSRPEAKAELSALEKLVGLAPKPLSGGIAKIDAGLGSELARLYRALLEKKPGLGGALRIRVEVDKGGRAISEEMVDDTVHDPALAANLTWNAHDAHYPPNAAKYVFKFALRP